MLLSIASHACGTHEVRYPPILSVEYSLLGSNLSISTLPSLGNTCYMNATVQVLGAVPELHTALNHYSSRGDPNANLVSSMRDLYSNMSKTTDGFPPMAFLQNLRTVQPRFMEQRQGVWAQQGEPSSTEVSNESES